MIDLWGRGQQVRGQGMSMSSCQILSCQTYQGFTNLSPTQAARFCHVRLKGGMDIQRRSSWIWRTSRAPRSNAPYGEWLPPQPSNCSSHWDYVLHCSLLVVRSPMQCPNAHLFCSDCIATWSRQSHAGSSRCPVCRAPGEYRADTRLRDWLDSRRVRCSVPECCWHGTLRGYHTHMDLHQSATRPVLPPVRPQQPTAMETLLPRQQQQGVQDAGLPQLQRGTREGLQRWRQENMQQAKRLRQSLRHMLGRHRWPQVWESIISEKVAQQNWNGAWLRENERMKESSSSCILSKDAKLRTAFPRTPIQY